MTVDQLKEVMKFHLTNLSATGVPINDETIHREALTEDGFGTANPRRIYKSLIRWTFHANNVPYKPWPDNWLDYSVADLAAKLLAGRKERCHEA
jgi:hypothetical protein